MVSCSEQTYLRLANMIPFVNSFVTISYLGVTLQKAGRYSCLYHNEEIANQNVIRIQIENLKPPKEFYRILKECIRISQKKTSEHVLEKTIEL